MKAITIWRARSSFRVGALSAAILLAATVFAEPVAAATISVLGSLPSNNPNDVFDVSQAGNSYGVGPGTTLNAAGYDVRDLFGGQFDPYVPERGGVVFGDNQAIGTVETVTVTLPQPVSIGSFDLILNEDGNNTGNRSTREFKLFSGAILIDDVFILNNSGTQSFTGAYGGNVLKISDTLLNVPSSSVYTMQFIQNKAASDISGLRATEFDAVAAPEPTSITLLGSIAGLKLLARKRRGTH